MPIGTLYFDLTKQVFIPVKTLLGDMIVIPAKGQIIRRGGFDVQLTPALVGINTPVKYYDILSKDSSVPVGYGFHCAIDPEILDYGLIYRYGRRVDKPPDLIHRSAGFYIYHAVNSATIITIPSTISEIEDLLLAI